MITRRDALAIVAGLLAKRQPQTGTSTCVSRPETMILDLGSPVGCPVQAIKVQLGAVSATIPTADLLKALGARLGG